jgi:Carboxypeptidase regulatory-like domain
MGSSWRTVLGNRFVLLPLLLAAVVVLWNGYVSLHDDGIVRGRVLGPAGEPVAGATVRLLEQNFTTHSDRGITTTRPDGSFEFNDNRSHSIVLRADKPGVGRSEQVTVRLYFRAQNVTLDAPLRLEQG